MNEKKTVKRPSNLPTIDIKGKPYVMVKDRIVWFWEHFPDYGLTCQILSETDDSVTIKALIVDPNNMIVSDGLAHETKEGFINQTSMYEVCETSAKGRALGNFGIGCNESIATAEEMTVKIKKQESLPAKEKVKKVCEDCSKEFSTSYVLAKTCWTCKKKRENREEGEKANKAIAAADNEVDSLLETIPF